MNQGLLATAFVLAAALVQGCAPPSNVQTARAPEARQDELVRYRAILADVSRNAHASEATVEIEKVRAWLETAQSLLAKDPESERTRLTFEAIRAELVRIRSFYARRQAEPAGPANPLPAKPEEEEIR